MEAEFDTLWETAPAVLGWAYCDPPDNPDRDLVQLRGAYYRLSMSEPESVVLMRSENSAVSMTAADLMVTARLLRSDLEEIEAETSGSRVSVVLDEGQVLRWQTNQAHARVILDRIAAWELDPHEDLLRAFRGTPSSRNAWPNRPR